MKNIYDLQINEVTVAEGDPKATLFTTVMRVPGGWIYRSVDKGTGIMGVAFVPFDNEFQSKGASNPSDINKEDMNTKKDALIEIDKEGVRFGSCWTSHFKIMRDSGQIFKNNYMEFISKVLGEEETPFKLNTKAEEK